MTKPLPFSPSSWDTFKNCGLQFYHKYVAKDLPPEPATPEQAYGTRVHKAFELRLMEDKPLPPDLAVHEPFLARLNEHDGVFWCEEKVAMGKDQQPCIFDDPDRWWRGVVDFRLVARDDPRAIIIDYKTGKPHTKFEQLGFYVLHTFAMFPDVDICDVKYYWTQTCSVTRKVWGRHEIPDIWDMVLPNLKQMSLAYKSDVWQERPSGLCKGWCPVRDCQHWEPPRRKR